MYATLGPPEACVGATLVKAKGKDRASVPERIMKLYNVFTHATQGPPPEGGRCFICGGFTDWICCTCGLWSHQECCQSLAVYVANQSDQHQQLLNEESALTTEEVEEIQERRLADGMYEAYVASSADCKGKFLASLLRFDDRSTSAFSEGSSKCELQISQSICTLCSYALASESVGA